MKRSLYQARPQGEDSKYYAPQRDLANLFMPMMREVCYGMDEKNWSDDLRTYCHSHGITEEQLAVSVKALSEAIKSFIREKEITTPQEALEAAGWNDVELPVRYATLSTIGVSILGGFFVAVRDVTPKADKGPNTEDMVDFLATIRTLLGTSEPAPDASEVETLRARAEEYSRIMDQQRELIESLRRELRDEKAVTQALQRRIKNAERVERVLRKEGIRRTSAAAKLAWELMWKDN